MESGQPPHFLWTGDGSHYWRELSGKKIELKQTGGDATFGKPHERHASELLRAGDDLQEIYEAIATDGVMRRAIGKYAGMRLTKNDAWETTVAFLCSQNSNIKRIRQNVRGMLGKDGKVMAAEQMAKADLRKLNLGYREPYLKGTAAMVASGEFDLAGVKRLSYEDGREELQLLPGVGPKVADCILLYGFGKLEAFPNDVWIGRAMAKWYGAKTPRAVGEFAQKRWGALAGYAQQYLFSLARDELAARKPAAASAASSARRQRKG